MTARPIPSLVPDRPACSAIVAPWVMWPKCFATSPSDATAPNCPKPAAAASSAVPTTAGSRQPWRCSRRSGFALSAMTAAAEPEGEVERGEQDERNARGAGDVPGPWPKDFEQGPVTGWTPQEHVVGSAESVDETDESCVRECDREGGDH